MNKIILTGRITKKIDINHTKSGKAIVNFDIAVKDLKKKNEDGSFGTNFIRCKLLGNGAINLEKYTNKGSRILVCGELKIDVIKQEDGSSKFFSYVWVNEVD
ncbi:single-stranded DNA-binding protein [Mycobacterium sp.]|uniref:single-stranded DNA-binding protein n=1 Tax=Mycobacterium sp. TaxID=1785 RepID=UPI003A8C00FD